MSQHRTSEEIAEAVGKLKAQVWYEKTYVPIVNEQKSGRKKLPDKIIEDAEDTAKEYIIKYGKKAFRTLTAYESGMINGKLSALEWVLGDEAGSLG